MPTSDCGAVAARAEAGRKRARAPYAWVRRGRRQGDQRRGRSRAHARAGQGSRRTCAARSTHLGECYLKRRRQARVHDARPRFPPRVGRARAGRAVGDHERAPRRQQTDSSRSTGSVHRCRCSRCTCRIAEVAARPRALARGSVTGGRYTWTGAPDAPTSSPARRVHALRSPPAKRCRAPPASRQLRSTRRRRLKLDSATCA